MGLRTVFVEMEHAVLEDGTVVSVDSQFFRGGIVHDVLQKGDTFSQGAVRAHVLVLTVYSASEARIRIPKA
jgi:hypothetical protein